MEFGNSVANIRKQQMHSVLHFWCYVPVCLDTMYLLIVNHGKALKFVENHGISVGIPRPTYLQKVKFLSQSVQLFFLF